VAVFGILFAAADVRELLYQLDESRTAVATIAGFLIGVHLLIARAPSPPQAPPVTVTAVGADELTI